MRWERDSPASAPSLDNLKKVQITQLNAPVSVKYSANLSSAEIRVLGSGLRVADRHCAISEVVILNGISGQRSHMSQNATRRSNLASSEHVQYYVVRLVTMSFRIMFNNFEVYLI